jgi:uncharacterized protein (DUF1330 family)
MLEFDSVDQAKKWWNSPAAKALRQKCATTQMIVVPGL